MRQEIVEIDKQLGIFRVTTLGERYYTKTIKDNPEGFSEYRFFPSSSWISGCYPKGIQYYQWLAKHGWDEAEGLKKEAGKKGSKTHYACEDLTKGNEVKIDSKYLNTITEQLEELTVEEYTNVKSFADWIAVTKPEILAIEITGFNDKYGYAGTIDYILRINGVVWIIDLKTSNYIWTSAELQIASYSQLDIDYKELGITDEEWKERKLAILQLGYPRNKNKYKFTEIENKFNLFLHAKAIWANENAKQTPKQIEYPISLKLEMDNVKVVGLEIKNNKLIEAGDIPAPPVVEPPKLTK